MTKMLLSSMTITELLDLFVKNCIEQDEADLEGNRAKYNRLFDRMMELNAELKRRPGDQRRELVRLFGYPDMQVRMQAAKLAAAVVPVEARAELQAIVDSKCFPQAGDAGMSLAIMNGKIKLELGKKD